MRARHMVGIAAFAISHQQDIAVRRTIRPLEKRETASLADGYTLARLVEGSARPFSRQLQRMKAVERGEAQAIRATDDGCVAEPQFDHAGRVRKGHSG